MVAPLSVEMTMLRLVLELAPIDKRLAIISAWNMLVNPGRPQRLSRYYMWEYSHSDSGSSFNNLQDKKDESDWPRFPRGIHDMKTTRMSLVVWYMSE